jgi:hypothetical protein
VIGSGRDVPRPFVVLHLGRTGSTYLVEALDAHPRVRARYEIMAALREQGTSSSDQVARAYAYLTGAEGADAAVGFKTKLRDILDPDAFAVMLRRAGARVIHLQRRNVVKQTASVFTSERVHERTGDWNLYAAPATGATPCVIGPTRFSQMLEGIVRVREALREYVHRLELPTLALYYEDLLLHHDETLRLAFSFLGVAPTATAGRTLKATSDDLRSAVANLDELRAVVGAEYAAMFDEILDRDAAEQPRSTSSP